MVLNGKELDLKFSSMNADHMERYEKAINHLSDRDEEFASSGITVTHKAIRFHCHTVFEFFNIIFGEGTDRLIFGDETDLGTCFKVLAEFTSDIGEGSKEVVSVASKYLSSRVQR